MKRIFYLLAAALTLALSSPPEVSALEGPHKVTTGEYKFVARDEPLVATDRMVDLWAEIYRPADLGKKPAPLLVFLHGNHSTCGRYDVPTGVRVDDRSDYTTTGICPDGYKVTPNHLGYAYMAEELASWGYVVVSINANRGITAGAPATGDRGLNLMRGRLILRHLALLSDWNRGKGDIAPPDTLGFDPKGALDFSQVGLMGHSRGGEGVRAALQQYRDAGSPFVPLIGPLTIRSLFEIGPVDGQTDRQLNADGVNSMILLPGCDGDVYNLQGMKVFDRVFTTTAKDKSDTFHGTINVWGANHNAYNTEWLNSDSDGCRGSNQLFPANGRSLPQQATAFNTLVPFFRATVGPNADGSFAKRFDPSVDLPKVLTRITNYDRGYLPSPIGRDIKLLESFSGPTGESDEGVPTKAVGVDVVHQEPSYEHDPSVRVATVSWDSSAPEKRYFEVDFASGGLDLTTYKTFAFRTALRCYTKICERFPSEKGEMNYTVSLVGKKGKLSEPVKMYPIVRISRPVGPNFSAFSDTPNDYLHSTLYTVETPLEAFGDVDLATVKGVRFTFDNKSNGVVDLSGLTVSKFATASDGSAKELVASPSSAGAFESAAKSSPAPTAEGNTIKVVRAAAAKSAKADAVTGGPSVDIVLTSKRVFPVTGSLPKLTVGKSEVDGGFVGADGKTMTISVPTAEYEKLDKSGAVTLFLRTSSPPWTFGALPN